MRIELEPASRWRQATFRNLWQFYLYEFSRFQGWPIPEDGRFAEDDLDGCWTNPRRHPFFLRVDGGLGGFALIDEREPPGAPPFRELTEFFVAPDLRRRGVGARAALACFERFPGPWEVRELERNVDAIVFWRKVLGRYTGGRFEEEPFESEFARGVLQRFDTRALAAQPTTR